jgi:hypothetical protein
MNLANKVALGLSKNFGQGLYDMITKLLGIRPFFNPHGDIMDGTYHIYRPSSLTPSDAINLNKDSLGPTKGEMQNFSKVENINYAYKAWCCESLLASCLPKM